MMHSPLPALVTPMSPARSIKSSMFTLATRGPPLSPCRGNTNQYGFLEIISKLVPIYRKLKNLLQGPDLAFRRLPGPWPHASDILRFLRLPSALYHPREKMNLDEFAGATRRISNYHSCMCPALSTVDEVRGSSLADIFSFTRVQIFPLHFVKFI